MPAGGQVPGIAGRLGGDTKTVEADEARGEAMSSRVEVHLLAQWLTPQQLRGGVAVVIDVLRATTTIVHALAAGCTAVLPEREVEAARHLARRSRPFSRTDSGSVEDATARQRL